MQKNIRHLGMPFEGYYLIKTCNIISYIEYICNLVDTFLKNNNIGIDQIVKFKKSQIKYLACGLLEYLQVIWKEVEITNSSCNRILKE